MTRTRLTVFAASISVIGFSVSAHAAPAHQEQELLRTIEYNCVKQIGEHTDHWPAWTKCIARKLWGWGDKVQESYNECWVPIWNYRSAHDICQQCGNPTVDALNCMRRGLGK